MPYVFRPNVPRPFSIAEKRRTPRSASSCVTILITGIFGGVVSLIGLLSGVLSGIAGAMVMAAAIALVIAGAIAQSDRTAGRTPVVAAGSGGSGAAGSGSGSETNLNPFFIIAAILLVAALGHFFYWADTHNTYYGHGVTQQEAREDAERQKRQSSGARDRITNESFSGSEGDYWCELTAEKQ